MHTYRQTNTHARNSFPHLRTGQLGGGHCAEVGNTDVMIQDCRAQRMVGGDLEIGNELQSTGSVYAVRGIAACQLGLNLLTPLEKKPPSQDVLE